MAARLRVSSVAVCILLGVSGLLRQSASQVVEAARRRPRRTICAAPDPLPSALRAAGQCTQERSGQQSCDAVGEKNPRPGEPPMVSVVPRLS